MTSGTLDYPERCLVALREYLALALGNDAAVIIGWIGNEPMQKDTAVICLQDQAADTEPHNATLHSFTTPDDGNDTRLTIDYGHTILNITADLYVRHRHQAKTIRSKLIARIRDAFAPTEPGHPGGRVLQLDDEPGTLLSVQLTGIQKRDDAEGLQRDEWRANLRFQCRHAVLHTVDAHLITQISIGLTPETLKPIDNLTD